MNMEEQLARQLTGFSVQGRDPLAATACFTLPPEFPAFVGHFPGNPLLPAFLQLAMVRLVVQQALAMPLAPLATERIKFGGFVRPGEQVEVETRIRPVAAHWQVEFNLRKGEERVAVGTMQFSQLQA